MGLIPGLGLSPGEGNGNPLQYSCLGNPIDRGSLVSFSPWGCKEVVESFLHTFPQISHLLTGKGENLSFLYPISKYWQAGVQVLGLFSYSGYPCPLTDLTSSFRYPNNSELFSLQTRPLPEHRIAFSTFPLGYLIGFLNLTLSKNTYVCSSPIFISENDTIISHSIFLGLFLMSLFLSPLHPVQDCWVPP